jgi:putative transposase
VKYAWIEGAHGYTVRTLCRALRVSPSGYYAWRGRQPAARTLDNQRLAQRIQQLHMATREAYGTERLWQALRQQGETCGRHRVRRLRQKHAIQTRRRRRYVRTRAAYQRVPAAPNRLTWPFQSPRPNQIWVADITYIPTQQGWLYLAAVLDVHSRRVVGWAMGDRPEQTLARDALAMALARRCLPPGAIHHSDQGSQYTSKAYQQQLRDAGLVASMSRKGMPFDNAVMESFFSSLKQELTHHERFKDRDAARAKIFEYIESFYNRQRLHSGLGYRSPNAFERMPEVTN